MQPVMRFWQRLGGFLRRQPKQLVMTLAIFGSLIAAVTFAAQPWRTVGNVAVASSVLPASRIQRDAQVTSATPWWQVVGQEAFIQHRMLTKDAALDQASVSMTHQGATLAVVDKMTTGYYQKTEHWYALDRNGRAEMLPGKPDNQAPIYVNAASADDRATVARAFATFDRPLRDNISQIVFSPDKTNPERIMLNMSDGNTVYATITTFAKKMPYYPSMAKQMTQSGVIDIQVGAYSRPYHVAEKKKTTAKSAVSQKSSNKNK